MSGPGRLPSLDLLRGFEAAARLLSFTRAAAELHLTQSAVSRQIQELESQIGRPLFARRHRALALTEAGRMLLPAATQALATVRETVGRIRALETRRVIAVTTSASFASLWLVPRLAAWRQRAPELDVRISADPHFVDLEREDFDLAVRFCTRERAGEAAIALFGETVFPIAGPVLVRDPARPLRTPRDLEHHVLLELDDPEGEWPWLAWRTWLEAAGVPALRPAGRMVFSEYDQAVRAAIDGMGVVLGRSALVRDVLEDGRLVAPFRRALSSPRAHHVVLSPRAAQRPEVARFVDWLREASSRERARP